MVERNILWYAVHTRARHEEKVAERLQRKSFDIFLPRIKKRSLRRDRKMLLKVPMFPGYLFVNCNLTNDSWLDIVRTDGVASLVGYERCPAVIPEEQIRSLGILDAADVETEPYPMLVRGDRIRVVRGPLAGMAGDLMEKRERGHCLVVNIEAIGRSITVHVDGSMVEKVG